MKLSQRITMGVAAVGLAFAGAIALAHPGGESGRGMGHGTMHGTMHGAGQAAGAPCTADQGGSCTGTGQGHTRGHRMGPGGHGATGGQSLLSTEEREAMRNKMRNAASPEERQRIAQENRAAVEQRAKERGVTLAPPRGPMMGHRMGPAGDAAAHDPKAH